MNLLQKYVMDIPRSPDEPAAPEPAAVEAVAEPAVAEPAAETIDEPVAAADPQPEPAPAPVPAARMVPVDVMIREVTPLRAKARELESELARTQRVMQEQNELLQRLQAKPGEQPVPVAPRSSPAVSSDDEVDRRAAERVFRRDAQAVSETGYKTYGQGWVDAVNALNAYGVNSDEFVASVMEIDRANAHQIMHDIAQDGERAVALANMTPARRIAEITRMTMAKAAPAAAVAEPAPTAAEPKAPAVSRAPAPKPSITPHAAAPEVDPMTPEGNEKMEDKQWEAWYKNKYMKRSA